jgi:hypothetical protein
MSLATTLYIRHLGKCPHKKDRNYRRCGCPVWFQRNRRRWSADTNDWSEALKQAAAIEFGGKAKAPYKDRYMLTQGSKSVQSLLA